jgi:hypothetical protein
MMRCLGSRRERILRWISIRTVRTVDGCAGLFVWPLFHCIHFTPPLTLLFLPLVHECEPSSFPTVSPSRIPACAIHVICMSVRASDRILPSLSYRASIFFLYLPIFLSFSSTRTVIQLLPVCYSQRLVAFPFFSYFNSQFFFFRIGIINGFSAHLNRISCTFLFRQLPSARREKCLENLAALIAVRSPSY